MNPTDISMTLGGGIPCQEISSFSGHGSASHGAQGATSSGSLPRSSSRGSIFAEGRLGGGWTALGELRAKPLVVLRLRGSTETRKSHRVDLGFQKLGGSDRSGLPSWDLNGPFPRTIGILVDQVQGRSAVVSIYPHRHWGKQLDPLQSVIRAQLPRFLKVDLLSALRWEPGVHSRTGISGRC